MHVKEINIPTIDQLPSPPPGKTGWPWTEGCEPLPEVMPNGESWPLISIVTPSYNQGQFLEETIRSVLLQGYPNLEYLIIDGGSTDHSVEIIKRYEPWLTYWVSENDGGQADAINRGWRRSTGEIIAWINADDTYSPKAFETAVTNLVREPNVDLVYGNCNCIDFKGNLLGVMKNWEFDLRRQLTGRNLIHQSSTFFYRYVYDTLKGLDESLNYVMDYDFWVRMLLAGFRFYHVPKVLSNYRLHPSAKTVADNLPMVKEVRTILEKIYQSGTTPANVLKWRNRAYSTYYRSIGDAYYKGDQMRKARREYLKAIRTKILRLTTFIVIFYILDTYLETRIGPALQRLRWKLPDVPKDDLLFSETIESSTMTKNLR